jgi:hypothetical protein
LAFLEATDKAHFMGIHAFSRAFLQTFTMTKSDIPSAAPPEDGPTMMKQKASKL